MTLNSILNKIPLIKKIPPERINDIRLVVGGHIVYLLIGGIYRGLPVLQDELIIHFSRNETNLLGKEFQPSPLLHNDTSYHVQTRISTKIASFTTVIMLGHMITGFFSGFYLNKIGVRWTTAVVGLLQALGYWFVALTLPNDNIFLTESILFVFNGLSGGLALAAATSSAKYSASKDRIEKLLKKGFFFLFYFTFQILIKVNRYSISSCLESELISWLFHACEVWSRCQTIFRWSR